MHASLFSAAPPKPGAWPSGCAERADLDVTLSLAGRTASPVPHAVPVRSGGFGGVDGLANYLQRACRRPDRCDASLCERMSANAAAPRARPVCRSSRCAGRRGARSQATAGPKSTMRARGGGARRRQPRHVFLALGRNELAPFATAPQHHYLIRSVDPVDPPLPLPHADLHHRRAARSAKPTTARCSSRTASTS